MPYTTLEFTAGSPKNLFAIMSIIPESYCPCWVLCSVLSSRWTTNGPSSQSSQSLAPIARCWRPLVQHRARYQHGRQCTMEAISGIMKHKEEQCCAGEQRISGLLSPYPRVTQIRHCLEVIPQQWSPVAKSVRTGTGCCMMAEDHPAS